MTIIKQDSFTAAVVPELLSAHTSDVGGGYQGNLLAGDYSINPSGTLLCSNSDRKVAFGDEDPATTDYEVEITGRTVQAIASQHFGVVMRASGANYAALTGYSARIQGDGYVSLQRYVAGAVTDLGSMYAIPSFAATTIYTLRLRVEGTNPCNVSAFLNDNLVIFYEDSNASRVQTAGNGGLYSRYGAGATSRTEIYSLLVEDLAGGGGGNTAPTVDDFQAADATVIDTTIIGISVFDGSDAEDGNPAGYAITESTTPPGASTSATPITEYDLGSYRSATLYPWVFDSEGLVSALYGSPISVQAVSSSGGGTTVVYGSGFCGGITS